MMGRLTTFKTLAGFDFSFQPALDKSSTTLAVLYFCDSQKAKTLIHGEPAIERAGDGYGMERGSGELA